MPGEIGYRVIGADGKPIGGGVVIESEQTLPAGEHDPAGGTASGARSRPPTPPPARSSSPDPDHRAASRVSARHAWSDPGATARSTRSKGGSRGAWQNDGRAELRTPDPRTRRPSPPSSDATPAASPASPGGAPAASRASWPPNPRLPDGTPFPTTYYLTCPRAPSRLLDPGGRRGDDRDDRTARRRSRAGRRLRARPTRPTSPTGPSSATCRRSTASAPAACRPG